MKTKKLLSLSVFAALVILSGCGYNRLQSADEAVKQSWSTVEAAYQRRFDLIPNLVETVKGYAKHEKDTLTAVMEARTKALQATSGGGLRAEQVGDPAAIKKYTDAQSSVSSALGRLLVVVEKYPDLKANENFRDLQAQLEGTENRINVARVRFAESIKEYNELVRHFPTNLTAKYLLHLNVRESFSAEQGAAQAPKVAF